MTNTITLLTQTFTPTAPHHWLRQALQTWRETFLHLDIVRRWKGRYVDSGDTQIFYCLLLYVERLGSVSVRAEGGGGRLSPLQDNVRQCVIQCGKCPHQAGPAWLTRRHRLSLSLRLISGSGARPEATLVSFLRTRPGSTSSAITIMIISIILVSFLHHTGLSQYDVVRLDPFRYVSPSLVVHSATAGDWDTINLHCPDNTKVRSEDFYF